MSIDEPSRRRQRWATGAVVLASALGLTLVLAGHSPAGAQRDLVAQGRQLYLVGCVSCHGTDGKGVASTGGGERGPTLVNAGEAGAYYQVSTGRMPLNDPNEEPRRSDPAYDPEEIQAITAYVASLGDGPALRAVDLTGADLAEGGAVFRANCQACHSATGSGGALSYGRAAPSLYDAEPEQIVAAVRSGPGQMPVFGSKSIDQRQLGDLVSYVRYLRNPRDRGGLPIGRVGPVPEGFIAWSIGVVLLLGCVYWIGTRSPARSRRSTNDEEPTTSTAQGGEA